MRWYFSIGAVFVAGAIAGGDVASVAAPNPAYRLAEKETVPSVDVELVLAVDVSYSMDTEELALQREGYAQALVSKKFLQALKTGPNGKISVTYFEWAASERPENRHSLARDRRTGDGGRSGQRDHEGAAAPRITHINLWRDQFRNAAVR